MNKLSSPFEPLFDEAPTVGTSLPGPIREEYQGDWAIPEFPDRPYTYSNFVLSHDGKISFAEPGHYGGSEVSGGCAHDLWLMGLLRARADAVMVGDNTLQLEPEHLWTHQYIFPGYAKEFAELRRAEGRNEYPYQVFLSMAGDINWGAEVFSSAKYHVIIATTPEGAARVESEKRGAAKLTVIGQDRSPVDLRSLAVQLRSEFGVKTLLVEGGPRAYGSAIADRIVDDEFLTLSPIIIGSDLSSGKIRPGLYEGIAFQPDTAVRMIPVSIRRNGDFMFVRYRCSYPDS